MVIAAVKVLIRSSLQPLQLHDIAETLHITASEVLSLLHNIQGHTLCSYLRECGIQLPQKLHLFTLPDLVWEAICQKYPQLYIYPLGEVTERALKSITGSLFITPGNISAPDIHVPITEEQLQQHLYRSSTAITSGEVLKLFLTHWFFNLAITDLRSKRDRMEVDLGFSYHFSTDGQLVPLDSQISLRDAMSTQCSQIASEFSLHLLESLKQDGSTHWEKQVATGLHMTLGFQPQKSNAKSASTKPVLNVIAGSRSKAQLETDFRIADDLTRIMLHGKDRNVSFDLGQLESLVGHRVHTLVKDLLEIGFVIYMTDLYVQRQPNLSRHLGVLIPVRHLEIWRQLQTHLESTISFLGRDRVSIHFTQRKEAHDNISGLGQPQDSNKCCCLLSGGLDSTVGAMWSLEQGFDPIFVSHSSGAPLSSIQKRVAETIAQVSGRL